jgi:ferredoxin
MLFLVIACLVLSLSDGFLFPSKFALSSSKCQALFAKDVSVSNLDNGQTITIPSGSPLSLAAVRSGLRLSFQCKQGVCSSCETMLDGQRVRTCITKVPEKAKITIKKAPKQR